MMTQIHVTCDGDWDEPEVQISGSAKALVSFGMLLNRVTGPITLEVPALENEFYPLSVNVLNIELEEAGDDRLTVTIDETKFDLRGNNKAFNKLGDSLVNFFDDTSIKGEHFQLDYYEGNEVLNETNCHLIFICDR